MTTADSTLRFSSRVENYIRYRPGYPSQVIATLKTECALTPDSVVADIACGTGIFTRMLLDNGNRVIGVEPNRQMREAAERLLTSYPNFTSAMGAAEATTLADHSVDFATAAQAAHWFDLPKARAEFVRILRSGGWAVLIWNERCTDTTPFLCDYENLLLRYGTDYEKVRHENTTDDIGDFFAPTPYESRVFDMSQELAYTDLEGRLLSSSYAPMPGHPNHDPMLQDLRRIFEQYKKDGRVSMDYITRLYFGQLTQQS
jgi:SAM-dependent methyltransferase